MLDIKFVRENIEAVKENMRRKFLDERIPLIDEALELDKKYRALLSEEESLRSERNSISQSINKAKKSGEDASAFIQQAKELPAKIKAAEQQKESIKKRLDELLMLFPNMLHESVKKGKDDSENVESARYGEPREFSFEVKSHTQIVEKMGLADFDASARVAGNGFYYLLGDLSLLNQALMRFGMDFMIKRGYTMVEPPLMVNFDVLSGTTPLKEIEDQAYKIENEDQYLIATSEFPLIGMFINQTFDHTKLPLKLCGVSPCFRKEIGSHGIDEKGLFRTHQFNKVEQIVLCNPDESWNFYDEMLRNSVDIFNELGLPIRVLDMCSGDTSDLKMKQADLEVWSPRRQEYFEVCSCSNLGDNQARLLNIRVRHHEGNYYPHTLNDTAIATSRAMVAILENYQEEDGSVVVPEVLRPYMYGKEKLEPLDRVFD
ncbi:MAG: serine--tRNA ligase [Nanoarchaeota archaeon]